MKALTKPEKFRAMSRIYGYEEESMIMWPDMNVFPGGC